MKIINLLIVFFVLLTSLACVFSAAQIPAKIQKDDNSALVLPKNELQKAVSSGYSVSTVIATESLNIRSQPNPDSEITGYLMRGEYVRVYACFLGWARISAEDKPERWVNSSYLSSKGC